MSKITLDNLSDNLKEYLEGLGLSEEQVNEIIKAFENEKIGDVNNLNTNSKTIIGAINEVKDDVDKKDLSAYQTVEDNNLLTTNKTIVEAINEVFQSGNSVKQELVATLLAKGLEATTDMSFNELINVVDEGFITPEGTAVVSDVLAGKTFINNTGELLTGTMVNRGSKTITPSASTQTLPAGYYSGITINGDTDLVASNIESGVTIFGINGNM